MTSIYASSLAVGYGKRPVVDNISLDMQPGELLVLIGTNGSGKSTLLKTLAGLIDPMNGKVTLLGSTPGQLPTQVAYLPQHPVSSHTLPLCVQDVVAMGRFAHLGLFKRSTDADRSIVLESMKMENTLRANGAGTVVEIPVQAGQAVEKGQLLVKFG